MIDLAFMTFANPHLYVQVLHVLGAVGLIIYDYDLQVFPLLYYSLCISIENSSTHQSRYPGNNLSAFPIHIYDFFKGSYSAILCMFCNADAA